MKLKFNHILLIATFAVTILTQMSLYIAEAVSLPLFVLTSLIIFLLLIKDFKGIRINLPSFSIPFTAISFIIIELYLSFYMEKQLLDAFVEIIIVLQIIKWISEKLPKDYLQIYTLSFIQLTLSSFFSASLPFAFVFFSFITIITFSFLLLTFKRELEKNSGEIDSEKAARSISIISKPHMTMLFAVTLIVFIVTFIIFFSFPRVGTGFFAGKYGLKKISGFSDSIVFGDIGTIIENNATAMRVAVSENLKKRWEKSSFYIKGGTLDTFDGRNWTLSNTGTEKTALNGEVYFKDRISVKYLDSAVITVEPSDYPVLFRTYDTVVIRGLRGNIYRDFEDNLFSPSTFQKKSSYEIYIEKDFAYLSEETVPEQRHLRTDKSWKDFKPIAEKIIISARNNEEKARSIEQYFKENFTYSLNSPSNKAEEPIKDFILNSKKGHCEYFATAMVAFLRELNIPARIATGYKGGEWNEFGSYYAVRQKNAHSWVEAYIEGRGWIAFDPTPPDLGTVAEAVTIYGKLIKYIDYVKSRWDRYVIEYSARDQREIMAKFKKERKNLNVKAFSALSFIKNNSTKFFIFTVLVVISIWIALIFSRKIASSKNQIITNKDSKLMASAIKLIEKKRKLTKENSETLEEFGLGVSLNDKSLGEAFKSASALYEKIRFGGYKENQAFYKKIAEIKYYLKKEER